MDRGLVTLPSSYWYKALLLKNTYHSHALIFIASARLREINVAAVGGGWEIKTPSEKVGESTRVMTLKRKSPGQKTNPA